MMATTPFLATTTTSTASLTFPCKGWCANNQQPWRSKCTWKKHCAGCQECTARLLSQDHEAPSLVIV
jgi:hypothetical protein